MKIFLIGYRATGKSTLARLLSQRLGVPYVDMDEILEEQAGTTISRLVEKEGWGRFREMERELLAELLSDPRDLVVSCGGGVPLHQDLFEKAFAEHFVVWLEASRETILERMGRAPGTRPPLTEEADPALEVARTLKEREPLYRRFSHIRLSTEGEEPEETAGKIADYAREHLRTAS